MTEQVAELWSALKPSADGLVAAVVQHADTGQVLMVGYVNRESLEATLATGEVTFWSRSRQELWRKGATSGNTLSLVRSRVDCDGDALLLQAIPAGPTCHTGATSCFFRELPNLEPDDGPAPYDPAGIAKVASVIRERQAGRGMTNREGKSYVRSLLEAGAPKIGRKLQEEAGELADAIADESDERVASEAADLIFHALVGLAHRGVGLDAVARVFDERFGVSGIDEKESRGAR